MSCAPPGPHRDVADWQVLVLELRAACCSNRLIAEEIGASAQMVSRYARGITAPARPLRAPLLAMAHEELDADALDRAQVIAPMPVWAAAASIIRWDAR